MTLQIWLSWLGDELGEFKAQKLKLSSVMLLMPNISTHLHWHQTSSRSNNFLTNFLLSLPFFFDVPLDHADSHATAAITHASHLWVGLDRHGTHLAVLTSWALPSGIEKKLSQALSGHHFDLFCIYFFDVCYCFFVQCFLAPLDVSFDLLWFYLHFWILIPSSPATSCRCLVCEERCIQPAGTWKEWGWSASASWQMGKSVSRCMWVCFKRKWPSNTLQMVHQGN